MYAGFIRRAAAATLDSLILSVIQLIVDVALAIGGFPKPLISLVNLVLLLFYYVYMESSSWQATLGKRIVGIKVTDLQGQRISFWRSLGRRLAMIFINPFTLGIGYLMCIWTEKRQCLHDMIAGCLVVTEQPSPTGDPRPTNPPVWVWLVGLIMPVLMFIFILGILVAISLPQYFNAVEKARSAEALQALSAMRSSTERYHSRAGHWPRNFDSLDTRVQGTFTDSQKRQLSSGAFLFEGDGWGFYDGDFTLKAVRAVNGQPLTGESAYTLNMQIGESGQIQTTCTPQQSRVCKAVAPILLRQSTK